MQRGGGRKRAPAENQDVGLEDVEDLGRSVFLAGVE
jgi:hypothetical protein